ncbi:MAG: sodium:solute symporter family protein [Candidatus Woesearchaeota archaeon]
MLNIAIGISILLYVIIIIAITIYSRRNETEKKYISGNNKVSFLGTMSSQFIGSIDGSGLITLIVLASSMYFGLYWLAIGFACAFLLLSFQVNRIRNSKYLTLNDFIEDRLGKRISYLTSVIILAVMFAFVANLIYVCGLMFSTMLPIPLWFAILCIAAFVGAYVTIGGYATVVNTDIFQMILTLALMVGLLLYGSFASIGNMYPTFYTMGFQTTLGAFLFGFLVMYPLPYLWQRIFTAKSGTTAKRALYALPVVYIIMYTLIIFLVISLFSTFPEIGPETIIMSLLDGSVSVVYGALLSVLMLALIMSNLDSQAYMFSSTLVSNIFRIDKDNQTTRYTKSIKVVLILLFIVATVLAMFITNFVTFAINITSLLFLLSPIVFLGVYTKKMTKAKDYMLAISLIIGIVVYILMFANGQFTSLLHNVIPTVVVGVFILVLFGVEKLLIHIAKKNRNTYK